MCDKCAPRVRDVTGRISVFRESRDAETQALKEATKKKKTSQEEHKVVVCIVIETLFLVEWG